MYVFQVNITNTEGDTSKITIEPPALTNNNAGTPKSSDCLLHFTKQRPCTYRRACFYTQDEPTTRHDNITHVSTSCHSPPSRVCAHCIAVQCPPHRDIFETFVYLNIDRCISILVHG